MNLIGHFVPIYNRRKCIWKRTPHRGVLTRSAARSMVRRIGPSRKPTRKVWAIYFDGPTAHLDCARRNPPPTTDKETYTND